LQCHARPLPGAGVDDSSAEMRGEPMRFPRGPIKLDDCEVHGLGSRAELFVVEGDSASQSVSRVCDATFQAVFPMQGKPMNAIRATEKKVAAHALFAALTDALGAGRGDGFDLARLRYDRVLLLMDPDADGIHCGVLILMFFHRWMRPLLDGGHVEMVRPPWGQVSAAGGDAPRFAWSDAQFRALASELRGVDEREVVSLRYRGLAGIDPPVLAATCVAPASRCTSRITTVDAQLMIEAFGTLPTT